MNRIWKAGRAGMRMMTVAAGCVVAMVLAGCGGEAGMPVDGKSTQLAGATVTGQFPASAYNDAVQQLYIAYFGRPADPGGLANFEAALSQAGAPTTVADISAAYSTNATIRGLVDAFGTSAESNALYTGGTSQFVTAIYRNVLNRDPDTEGLQFWSNAIDNGGLSKGNAALSIMAGALANTTAQGLIDAQIVTNKTVVGTKFTSSLVTATQINAYKGNTAAATARSMLSTVTNTTDTSAFQTTIDATISTLVANAVPSFSQVQSIIMQRCVPCHSATPTQPGFSSPPNGITFDTEAEIRAEASSIYQVAVQSKLMPFGNATGMTDAERSLIGQWFTAGAN